MKKWISSSGVTTTEFFKKKKKKKKRKEKDQKKFFEMNRSLAGCVVTTHLVLFFVCFVCGVPHTMFFFESRH